MQSLHFTHFSYMFMCFVFIQKHAGLVHVLYGVRDRASLCNYKERASANIKTRMIIFVSIFENYHISYVAILVSGSNNHAPVSGLAHESHYHKVVLHAERVWHLEISMRCWDFDAFGYIQSGKIQKFAFCIRSP